MDRGSTRRTLILLNGASIAVTLLWIGIDRVCYTAMCGSYNSSAISFKADLYSF